MKYQREGCADAVGSCEGDSVNARVCRPGFACVCCAELLKAAARVAAGGRGAPAL